MSNVTVPPVKPLEPHRTAIVLGGSSGIGAALARHLVKRDYYVAIVARREALLTELCADINSYLANGDQALAYVHNVADFAETETLFQQISADLKGLDLIIYAAGLQPPMSADEYNFEKDAAMINVNLLGAMAWLNLAAARFVKAGEGHIVGISSIAADRGRRQNPGYNTSKAGLATYLEALRNRVSRDGVSVTTVKPGFVDTRLLENAVKTMWVISPDQAARQIIDAIEHKKQVVYVPKRWRFVSLAIQHTPSIIFRRLNI